MSLKAVGIDCVRPVVHKAAPCLAFRKLHHPSFVRKTWEAEGTGSSVERL